MANYGDKDKKGKKWEDYKTIKCPDGEVIDMEKLLDEQEWAKAALLQKCPIWGKFIEDLHFVYTFRVNTQATDGAHLFVNPQFTYHLSPAEKVFVMAHEIMHCLLYHLRRSNMAPYNTNHDKCNIAADYECNDTLVEMGVVKQSTIESARGYYDEKFKNKGFEAIWDMMGNQSSRDSMKPNQSQNQNKSQQGQGGGNSGGGSGDKNNQKKSDAYKRGWEIAKKLYEAGKLKV